MGIEEYYVVILSVLTGLTLIAFFLLFLYMIYGAEEESTTSSNVAFFKKTLRFVILWPFGPSAMF